MKPVSNPPNPWESVHADWLGEPPEAKLQVFEERARSILSRNESPDVGFRWSLNPYRGCFHGCAYCYARPTHQYLGFGAGTDFDRKLVVKVNAAEKLREEFSSRRWEGEPVAFSGNTDCYQPLEAVYGLTRRCLEICADFRNPVSVITKGALVRRDLDLLAALARRTAVCVFLSIPFSNDSVSRALEPGASLCSQRFETLRLLSEAGIPTGVGVAPVIPGLNDSQIAPILARARDAGAREAFLQALRLPSETLAVFRQRLEEVFPERSRKIWNAILEMREGRCNETRFGDRMRGQGPRWEAIEALFEAQCRQLELGLGRCGRQESDFQRTGSQASLFEDTHGSEDPEPAPERTPSGFPSSLAIGAIQSAKPAHSPAGRK